MIRWTSREWDLIAQRLVDNEVDPDRHGWRSQLIDAMKAVLPLDRWRDTANLNNAKDILKPLMKTIVTGPQHLPPPKGPVSFVPALPTIQDLSTEDLLVELAHRIAKFLEPKSKPFPVDRGFHPKHDPRPQSEVRPAKIKVLIIGPRGPQQDRLRTAFPTLDLRFVLAEELPSLVMTRSADCREIILWTKFMNHAQQTVAQNTGINTWYANGMEEIEARLRSYG